MPTAKKTASFYRIYLRKPRDRSDGVGRRISPPEENCVIVKGGQLSVSQRGELAVYAQNPGAYQGTSVVATFCAGSWIRAELVEKKVGDVGGVDRMTPEQLGAMDVALRDMREKALSLRTGLAEAFDRLNIIFQTADSPPGTPMAALLNRTEKLLNDTVDVGIMNQ